MLAMTKRSLFWLITRISYGLVLCARFTPYGHIVEHIVKMILLKRFALDPRTLYTVFWFGEFAKKLPSASFLRVQVSFLTDPLRGKYHSPQIESVFSFCKI